MFTHAHHTRKAPVQYLKEHQAPAPSDIEETDATSRPSTGDTGPVLVCKLCRTVITRKDLGMEVDGKHRHVFFNPHGLVFEIGCFASARHLAVASPKSEEFSWFPGYAWESMVCSECFAHMGWRFTGRDSGFYGLILANLVEEQGRKI